MDFKTASTKGAKALAIFGDRLFKERNIKLVSIEGSSRDLIQGVDYELYNEFGEKFREGSHRHWGTPTSNYAHIRFSRYTGAKTDFHKLEGKPDNYIYSFSFGEEPSEGMKIRAISARSLRAWIDANKKDLEKYRVWPFNSKDSSFLEIPFSQLSGVKDF
jgi:hypothetical protein